MERGGREVKEGVWLMKWEGPDDILYNGIISQARISTNDLRFCG